MFRQPAHFILFRFRQRVRHFFHLHKARTFHQHAGAFGQIVADRLADNDIVALEGWGQFELKKKAERYSADAESGKRYLLPPKLIPVFRPSSRLRTYIKNLDQA